MVNFTIKQCRYFNAIAHHGGVAQAARVLNISQPAISQALDKLEECYGFTLFIRHHAKGMELTTQGRDLLVFTQEFERNAEALQQKARAIAKGITGTINFGCFHTIAPFYVPYLIKSYSQEFPMISVTAFELQQEQLLDKIIAGELDVALTYDMELNPALFQWQVIAHLRPHVILSVDHKLAGLSAISLHDLKEDPYVTFEGFGSKAYFGNILRNIGLNPKISHGATSMESVRCSVANGLGYSISVMQPKPQQTYDGNQIVTCAISDDIPPLDLVLVTRKGFPQQDIVRSFQQFCMNGILSQID